MKLESSVFVDRPVEEVFARLLNLEQSPEWALNFGVIERRKLTDGPSKAGTKFHAADRMLGRVIEYEVAITGYEQDHYLAASWSEPIGGGWEARFEPKDGGTQLTFAGEMNPTGALKLMSPLLSVFAKRATRRDLDRFKRWVESATP